MFPADRSRAMMKELTAMRSRYAGAFVIEREVVKYET